MKPWKIRKIPADTIESVFEIFTEISSAMLENFRISQTVPKKQKGQDAHIFYDRLLKNTVFKSTTFIITVENGWFVARLRNGDKHPIEIAFEKLKKEFEKQEIDFEDVKRLGNLNSLASKLYNELDSEELEAVSDIFNIDFVTEDDI